MNGQQIAFGGLVAFPRLSTDCPNPRDLDTCQFCGGKKALGAALRVWCEYDDQDQPTNVFLVLCRACADRHVEPHARMYAMLAINQPAPGAMECCRDCRYQDALNCRNPLLRSNGGEGLPIRDFAQGVTHINMGKKPHVWMKNYAKPPECQGHEV